MLNHILNSGQKVNILRLLITRQDWIFSESEISRELKAPKATIHRQIKQLVGSNILKGFKKGNTIVYKINKDSLVVQELLEPLFKKEYVVFIEKAKQFCKKLKGVKVGIVFGSAAKKDMKPTSDIDIAIISDNTKSIRNLEQLKADYLEKYSIIFSTHIFSTKVFKERYNN